MWRLEVRLYPTIETKHHIECFTGLKSMLNGGAWSRATFGLEQALQARAHRVGHREAGQEAFDWYFSFRRGAGRHQQVKACLSRWSSQRSLGCMVGTRKKYQFGPLGTPLVGWRKGYDFFSLVFSTIFFLLYLQQKFFFLLYLQQKKIFFLYHQQFFFSCIPNKKN